MGDLGILERWPGPGGPVRLEVGLHPASYTCEACSAARSLLKWLEKERPDVEANEVAPVVPGREGEASPPPWIRVLLTGEEDGPVRFLGPPRGANLSAFLDVLQESARGTPPDAAWSGLLSRLRRHHLVRVFTEASAGDTAPLVRTLARLGRAAYPRLSLDVIDVATFPSWATRHGLRALPTVTVDQVGQFYGSPEEEELRAALEEVLPSGAWP
jgi:hypothetical protein